MLNLRQLHSNKKGRSPRNGLPYASFDLEAKMLVAVCPVSSVFKVAPAGVAFLKQENKEPNDMCRPFALNRPNDVEP